MISKEKLLQSFNDLPDNFTIDELLDRILFLQKVDTGLKQSESGQVNSTKTAKDKLKKWLK